MQKRFQVQFPLIQIMLSSLHSGHFQNVIDQLQKLFGSKLNLFQVFPVLGTVSRLTAFFRQITASNNYIERCPHIVGHASEKFQLGFCALLSSIQGVLKNNCVLQFPALFLIYIPETEDDLVGGHLGVV